MKLFAIEKIVLVACLLALYACHPTYAPHPVLLQAEQLMAEHPDSALMLLSKVDSTALSGRNHADWCLLITQARDIKKEKPTSDSLIRIACAYYEAQPDPERLMSACFIAGKVNQSLGDAPMAQEYYLKGLAADETSDNVMLKAKLCSYIGMLYTHQSAYLIALPYMHESLHYLSLANDTLGPAIVFRDIARTYHKLKQVDSAEIYYRKAVEINHPREQPYILNELGGLLMDQKEYEAALPYLRRAIQTATDDLEPIYLTMGELFYRTGNSDSAHYYLQQSVTCNQLHTKVNSSYFLAKLALLDKKYDVFQVLQNQYEDLRDSLQNIINTEVMIQGQTQYNYTRYREMAEKEQLARAISQRNLYRAILIGFFVFICLIASVFIAWHMKKKWTERVYQMQKKNEELMQRDKVQNAALAQKEEELAALRKKQVSLEQEFRDTAIYHKFMVGKGTYSAEDRGEFYKAFDKAYPNFFGDVLSYFPDMDDEDKFIAYMTKIKLEKFLIASYLGISSNSLSNRRKRMVERILEGKARASDFDRLVHGCGMWEKDK